MYFPGFIQFSYKMIATLTGIIYQIAMVPARRKPALYGSVVKLVVPNINASVLKEKIPFKNQKHRAYVTFQRVDQKPEIPLSAYMGSSANRAAAPNASSIRNN